jgi:transcriptional regulator with XRE-family HTH domain
MPPIDLVIGRNLRHCRRRARLSRATLAATLRCHVSDVEAFETGERRLGPRRLCQASRILRCPLTSFFSDRTPELLLIAPAEGSPELVARVNREAVALAQAYYLVHDYRRDAMQPRSRAA